jgi:putative transposase
MQLIERHILKPNHKFYAEADKLCFLSKNLYNCGNYMYRQNFFAGQQTNALAVYHTLKAGVDYKALPAKVAQNTLGRLLLSWTSYYKSLRKYTEDPSSFKAAPQIPSFKGSVSKQRADGRYVVVYNYQAVSKKALKKGYANPSGTSIQLKTKASAIDEIRIVPRKGCYLIEVVYTKVEEKSQDAKRAAAVDIGLNNLATLTFNVPKIKPKIYDGRALKSCNQYSNKQNAILRKLLPKNTTSSQRLHRLWHKRNCKVDYYLHKTSRAIVNELVHHQIGLLIIGWDKDFNDEIHSGKNNNLTDNSTDNSTNNPANSPAINPKFICIPYKCLLTQLRYKAQLAGIQVVVTEESYTSKCSSLDLEPIEKHSSYQGSRVKRGLFRTKSGKCINADVNGSLNIGRKVVGNEFISHPIEGVVVHPVRVKAYKH